MMMTQGHKGLLAVITLTMAFFLSGCGSSIKAENDRNESADPVTFAEQTIRYVNEERKKHGLRELKIVPQLMQASQFHAEYMARNDCYEHKCPNGPTVADRFEKFNYRAMQKAENIGAGYTTPWAAFEGWMNSPGHRANILNPASRVVGAGYFHLPDDGGRERWGHYWAMNFAMPLYSYDGTPDEAAAEAMRLANELRRKNGLPPFNTPAALATVAREEARLMGNGDCACNAKRPYTFRLKDAGYDVPFVRQYMYGGLPTPDLLVRLIAESSADKNLLDAATRDIGIGYYFRDDGSANPMAHYWVVLYGIQD